MGKDRWVKTCLLGNPSGELPHHADAHAQLHSACCCQPDDILLWKNTLKSWHEMIRFLLDFRLDASTVHSKVLKSSVKMWLNMVRRWWDTAPPGGRGGSSGVKPLPRQCPTRGIWVSETQSVSLVSRSFLAPRFGDLLAVHVLGTDSYHFQVIFLGESS